MLVTLIRAAILYVLIIFCVRLMGKRQVGELQPVDLVMTVLISEIAAIPIQQNNLPILNSVVAVLLLVGFELVFSLLNMKFQPFRTMMQGRALVIIRNGVIDQKQIKRLRLTVNDIMSALRQKDVFDLNQVSYAIFETNGKISILLKPDQLPATAADAGQNPPDNGMPFVVVCDGKLVKNGVSEAQISLKNIEKAAKAEKLEVKDILIMTADKNGKTTIVRRDGNA